MLFIALEKQKQHYVATVDLFDLYVYFNFLFFQGPSASAYVTYIRSEDALRAIQCVNNVVVDGRTLKVRSCPWFVVVIRVFLICLKVTWSLYFLFLFVRHEHP